MSRENVEVVRRGFEAYMRGDLATVHTLREGKLVRMDEHMKRDETLQAAGLSE